MNPETTLSGPLSGVKMHSGFPAHIPGFPVAPGCGFRVESFGVGSLLQTGRSTFSTAIQPLSVQKYPPKKGASLRARVELLIRTSPSFRRENLVEFHRWPILSFSDNAREPEMKG